MNEVSPVSLMDKAEAALATLPPVELPLKHTFTTGLYGREIFMPKGSILTSKKHLTQHQFVVLSGKVAVLKEVAHGIEADKIIEAPYHGVTEPGTKRLLYALEDTIWMTFHATELTDPDQIVEEITEEAKNPLVDNDDPRFNTWKTSVSPSIVNKSNELLEVAS